MNRPTIAAGGGVLLVALLGALDYLTGYEISFSIFYLVPIALVTWVAGLPLGIAASILSAATWLSVDLYGGQRYSQELIPYWNAFVRLGFFVTVAFLIAQRKAAAEAVGKAKGELEFRVAERTAQLEHSTKWLESELAERRRLEEKLQLQAAALESAANAILITDREGKILWVNPAFTQVTGYAADEVLGENPRILKSGRHPPEFYEHVWKTILAGQVWHGEMVNQRKNGSLVYEETTITPVRDAGGGISRFVAIKLDVTEKRNIEEQLRQAQKMEAIGLLAGGIAHDFNNLLGVIIGYSELLLEGTKPDDPRRKQLQAIAKAGGHAASLTRQLLAFSRKQVLEPVVLDLNAVVSDVTRMLRRLLGEHIKLVVVAGRSLGRVKADPSQIEQVVINLAVNARDAMPQGGQLTIETANVELDEDYRRRHPAAEPGRHVMLAVSDTGAGMDEETQGRIFEPFFTTKEMGKGTGLGLATVYGIVKQSGGYIWVYSEPGQGTTFKVYFPRVEEAAEEPAAVEGQVRSLRGTETILLVEDAEALRLFARESLLSCGYTVLDAGSGVEAREISARHKEPIHLLLTDVVLPRMSGRELAEHLAPHRPEMKVLFMSGYTDDAIVYHGVLKPGTSFLQKPFSAYKLRSKVREVLDAPKNNG